MLYSITLWDKNMVLKSIFKKFKNKEKNINKEKLIENLDKFGELSRNWFKWTENLEKNLLEDIETLYTIL